ncbi:MAG: 30S ribosomal protein S20 [Planctomycetes bacterium]|nr:30S ribosomal protein S20 [Planctomycetota bacterium]
MAHSPSAKKRIRQNEKRRLLNRRRVSGMKQAMREFEEKLRGGDKAGAGEALKVAYKKIDQVAAKGVLHKNTAARRKSRLAKALAKAGA